jgi:hypothetical protein
MLEEACYCVLIEDSIAVGQRQKKTIMILSDLLKNRFLTTVYILDGVCLLTFWAKIS